MLNGRYQPWIDLVKCIAILAVLVDHVFGYDVRVGRTLCVTWSFFSVSLFMLIGGYNAGRHQESCKGDTLWLAVPWRGVNNLLVAYLFAVAIYHVIDSGSFNLMVYLRKVISFNSPSPFYFVAFYLQLLVISPFLYRLLRRYPWPILFGVAVVAHWCTRHTLMCEPAYGAGKCLLGGYFLFAYAIGMVLFIRQLPKDRMIKWLAIILAVIAIVLWCEPTKNLVYRISDTLGYMVYNVNPSGLLWQLAALSVFLLVYANSTTLSSISEQWILRPFLALGRCSMVIFLYHVLVLLTLDKIVCGRMWVGVCGFVLAAFIPMLGVVVFRRIAQWLKSEL